LSPAHWGILARTAFWLIWLIPLYLVYLLVRLSEIKRRASKREELFRLISENAADMIALVDVTGHRLYNSPAYKKVLGYSPNELSRTSAFEQIHPDDRAKIMAAAEETRRTGVGKTLEYRIRHKDGSWRVLESSASAIRNQKGEVEKLVIVNRDVTERKRTEEKLAHNALHDALTDLPNRVLFLDQSRRAFERAKRNPDYKFAVLFVDIDGFKVFNDTLGHAVGDDLIVQISRRLEGCVRFEDTVARPAGGEIRCVHDDEMLARLGGDEFTILVGPINEPSQVMRVAQRIQDALKVPFQIAGRQVFTSASIGISLSTTPHARADELLRDADIAMARAKALGKSRCEFFDPEMHARAVSQLNLETDLRRALDAEEFCLHYQPIVHLQTRHIAGFEALLRWHHPEQGPKPPQSFISVAERTGLVVPLGKWILREACRQAQAWRASQPWSFAPSVSVNVSPKQFAHPQLVSDIATVLAETGIAPQRLQLEITEGLAMADPEKTLRVMRELKNLGVLISIDDFGTGHSSLARLRRFPADILKIDRSFIVHLDSDPGARQIVRLIIEFAQAVNLKVIAEGVETGAHAAYLGELGCEFVQGFFFSKPLDPEQAKELLRARVRNDGQDADLAQKNPASAAKAN